MKRRALSIIVISFVVITISFFTGLAGAGTAILLFDDDDGDKNNSYPLGDIIQQDLEIVNEESAIIDVAEQASNSVVSIVITKDVPVFENYFYNPFGNDPFFEGFDFGIPQQRQNGTEEQQVGAGTGFVISEDGMIITNRHVVSDEDASYTVIFNDGEQFEGEVIARDTLLDIAFLSIEGAPDLSPLSLGTSSDLKVGQIVIAIGNALGEFSNTVSSGIISGLKRDIIASDSSGYGAEEIDNVIQTDASINPGNSGGPLLDSSGNVIGVNVAVATDAENIGFAIPVDLVKDLMERLNEDGTIDRPQLGVRYIMVTEDLASENNLDLDYGALITRGESANELAVIPGSPADKAGLKENDIILEIDGEKIDLENRLIEVVQKHNVGDEVEVKILRQGEEKVIEVTLEKM